MNNIENRLRIISRELDSLTAELKSEVTTTEQANEIQDFIKILHNIKMQDIINSTKIDSHINVASKWGYARISVGNMLQRFGELSVRAEARKIRNLDICSNPEITQSKFAKKYGISIAAVWQIRNRNAKKLKG